MKTYGKSSLVAFCEEVQRQRDILEFRQTMNTNRITSGYDNRKRQAVVNAKNDDLRIQIIPIDQPIEWLPMCDKRAICNAFGVPYELLIRI